MNIGIDVSQVVYEGTGVARYVNNMVRSLLKQNTQHSIVLLGVTRGRQKQLEHFFQEMKTVNPSIRCVNLKIPIKIAEFIWNRLHIIPIERVIGNVDIFWTSDWFQPPTQHAKKVTTVHDVSFLKYPDETDRRIVAVQARLLHWIEIECEAIFCDSQSTREDILHSYDIPKSKLHVVYPGIQSL